MNHNRTSTGDPSQLKKEHAAQAALDYLRDDMVLGVGTGSTVNVFIELLKPAGWQRRLRGAVSSSEATSSRLRAHGIEILELNRIAALSLYIDGADEATRDRKLIKGGGGALTCEKIVAAVAERFVCIVDDSKLVDTLGRFPLPVEVIPMARGYVAGRLTQLGGRPVWRQGFTSDCGNHIIDVHGLSLTEPLVTEAAINQIAGVVTVGLFCKRPADLLLVGTAQGLEII